MLDKQAVIEKLRGCFLPLPTLFNDDLSLNLDGMRQHVRFLLEHGMCQGNATILVAGGAGEFPTMTTEERKQVAEAVVDEAAGRIAIIVGAQSTSTLEVMEIAQHAQAVGATAIQVGPPFYYPPTEDDVYEWFHAIAQSAPEIGMVLYNTYWLNYDVTLEMIERLCEGVPQLVALKWGTPSMFKYQEAFLRFRGRLGIIDNHILPVFNQLMGGIGINVHPGLFFPEHALRLWELLESRQWEEAQAEVNRIYLPYYRLLVEEVSPYTSGEALVDKLGMAWRGLPGGPNRPPTRALTPSLRDRVLQFFREIELPRG